MITVPITVRQPGSIDEILQYFQWSNQAFSSNPSPEGVQAVYKYVTALPEYRPESLRGVFRADKQSGGYIFLEREMSMGVSRLRIGCIAGVVADPSQRLQGTGRAMMLDALNRAQVCNCDFLMLDGIPNFYNRWGYTDVFDLFTHSIHRSSILAQPSGPYTVRQATKEDAAILLTFYNRHFGPYTGSFVRSLEQQAHRLSDNTLNYPYWIASNPEGQPQGYILLPPEPARPAQELVADNWQAALALLQHHANRPEYTDPATILRYRLPLSSPILRWMVDQLDFVEEWSVLSQSEPHRSGGWMAHLVNFSSVMQLLIPELQARWHRSLAHWSGKFTLQVEEEEFTVSIDGSDIRAVEQPDGTAQRVRMTPQLCTQIVFGYRPVAQIREESNQNVSDELLTVLNILFPSGHTWIPSSDWF